MLLGSAKNSSSLNAANDVVTVAATLTGAAATFSYTDANTVDVGTASAVDGITTSNGNVTVTSVAGDVTLSKNISAGSGAVTLAATAGTVTETTGGVSAPTGSLQVLAQTAP